MLYTDIGGLTKIVLGENSIAVLLDQLGHQSCPPRLVAGSDARTVVAVEILVKGNEVAPMRVCLKFFRAAENRPASLLIEEKNAREPLRNIAGYLPKVEHLARIGGAFDFVFITEEEMKFLQGFNE